MIRTQVQFTEDQMKKLKELASQKNTSIAELVRQGVDVIINRNVLIDHSAKISRAIDVCGRFHSGRKDISTRHDDFLGEAYTS
jgi:hypothetical protein